MRRSPQRSQEIAVDYNGVHVVYNEGNNKWKFDVRGREREADSLEAAKLVIDRPEPKEKPPFDRFEAWHLAYGDSIETVTVTSVAYNTASWRSDAEVWVSSVDGNGKPDRSKKDVSSIYPKNPHNDPLIDEIIRLDNRKTELDQAIEAAKKKLKCFKVPGGGK